MSSACVMIVLRLEIITFAREIMLDPDKIMLLAMCQAMKGKNTNTNNSNKPLLPRKYHYSCLMKLVVYWGEKSHE